MKKRARFVSFILTLVLILTILPVSASANSPAPSPRYSFHFSNLPEGTVYVDLLICLPESDPLFAELNADNIPDGFTENAQILTWCEDDYRSYTFHYRDAISVIRVNRSYEAYFFADSGYQTVRVDHADEIFQRGKIRLAMLDHRGNIIKISPLLDLSPRGFLAQVAGEFSYNGKTDEFEVETYTLGFAWILYFILCFAGVVFTCIIERLAAIPFGLGKRYGWLIVMTNVVSQLLMHVTYGVFYSFVFWKYTYATIVLEILVYIGEYLFYRWRMKDIPCTKLLAYAVTANTCSLVMGILILSKFN